MVVSIKDTAKLFGISIIVLCATLICTMFVNFGFDLATVKDQLTTEQQIIVYDAQSSTVKVLCLTAGNCMLATSVVMLFFYIKHYIDTHKKELGIIKALGYSNFKIAKNFWTFGASVLIGAALGFAAAWLLMPWFYEVQNKDHLLPNITMKFHWQVPFLFVLVPTVCFSLMAIGYACLKLRRPALSLLREMQSDKKVKKHKKTSTSTQSFLVDLKRNTLSSKKVLAFFVFFASFCYSAMTQMSFSMKDLSSEMMGLLMLIIGLSLAFVIMFLAVTTVVRGNTKTIAMMRAYGYSEKECSHAILGCYRPLAYIGFVIGTGYQYGLLRMMVDIVFRDFPNMPVYEFDVPMMFISLVTFVVLYEAIVFVYARRIRKVSVREIMAET